MVTGSSQLIENAPWNKRRGNYLRRWMIEVLSRVAAEVLEHADVLEAAIALQVLDALCAQGQVSLDFMVVRDPQMPVVPGVFHHDFVGPHGIHLVVEAVSGAARITLDPVHRPWIHHAARQPR